MKTVKIIGIITLVLLVAFIGYKIYTDRKKKKEDSTNEDSTEPNPANFVAPDVNVENVAEAAE